jgi:3-deoxy-D-manno-octulosonate 8-phosphate phosphatase (KDO 8-P phosphatase)
MKIKAVFMDVDGVLTDGKINIDNTGKEVFKSFHSQDTAGIIKAQKAGLRIAWVSAKESEITLARARNLHIDFVRFSLHKKSEVEGLCASLGISASETCFIGDDDTDIEAMRFCGMPIAVFNAVDEVKKIALYVTSRLGGAGAVREAIEHILVHKEHDKEQDGLLMGSLFANRATSYPQKKQKFTNIGMHVLSTFLGLCINSCYCCIF